MFGIAIGINVDYRDWAASICGFVRKNRGKNKTISAESYEARMAYQVLIGLAEAAALQDTCLSRN
jgi:hypothetical protein